MAKISQGQLKAQLELITRKLSEGYTDGEIMNELKIKRSTFYVYKSRIFDLFGDIAAKKSEKSLELEAELLKDRYTRLFRTVELGISQHVEGLGDIAAAAEVGAFIATNIFKLEVEGLRARQGKRLQLNEQKAVRYLGNIQSRVSESDTTSGSTAAEETSTTTNTAADNDTTRPSSEVF